jgi:hypothetical protein
MRFLFYIYNLGVLLQYIGLKILCCFFTMTFLFIHKLCKNKLYNFETKTESTGPNAARRLKWHGFCEGADRRTERVAVEDRGAYHLAKIGGPMPKLPKRLRSNLECCGLSWIVNALRRGAAPAALACAAVTASGAHAGQKGRNIPG